VFLILTTNKEVNVDILTPVNTDFHSIIQTLKEWIYRKFASLGDVNKSIQTRE